MLRKLFTGIILFFTIVNCSEIYGQNLVVKQNDGELYSELLSNLQKLSFSNGNLVLDLKDGTVDTYLISDVSTVYLNSSTTDVSDLSLSESSEQFSVYPNPAGDNIYFKNAGDDSFIVTIYRIDGKQVAQVQVSSGSQAMDVSNLDSGIYIVKINNQARKFIKL